MSETVLLKAATVEITTKVARFGNTSFQVANIGSVSLNVDRQINPFAIFCFLAGAAIAAFGFAEKVERPEYVGYALAIGATVAVFGFIIQLMWPRQVFTFLLKTSSNDVQKLVSTDGDHLDAIRTAVENAFIERA
jgi:hypothetical protein